MQQAWRSHYNAIYSDWVEKHNRTTCNDVGNCSSKTGSRRQSEKKTILKLFLKGFLQGKSLAPKLRKSAICHHSVKKRIELRTQEQPLVAKSIGGTDWTRNDPNRNRRTHEVPFIAGCSHFTRKSTRFRAPASSPQHSPCNIHAAIPMRSATTASRNA